MLPLRLLLAITVLLTASGCGLPNSRTLFVSDSPNEKVEVVKNGNQIGRLVVGLHRKDSRSARFFLLAQSSTAKLGRLSLSIYRSADGGKFWCIGSSDAVPEIKGCLDVTSLIFFTNDGVDRSGGSVTAEVNFVRYEKSEFPAIEKDAIKIFDERITE